MVVIADIIDVGGTVSESVVIDQGQCCCTMAFTQNTDRATADEAILYGLLNTMYRLRAISGTLDKLSTAWRFWEDTS